MSQKYIVIRKNDINGALSPEDRLVLSSLLAKINEFRTNRKLDVNEVFFALNIRDKFAQPAIEAYIKAAQGDKLIHEHAGLKQAVQVAQQFRAASIMAGIPRLPSEQS